MNKKIIRLDRLDSRQQQAALMNEITCKLIKPETKKLENIFNLYIQAIADGSDLSKIRGPLNGKLKFKDPKAQKIQEIAIAETDRIEGYLKEALDSLNKRITQKSKDGYTDCKLVLPELKTDLKTEKSFEGVLHAVLRAEYDRVINYMNEYIKMADKGLSDAREEFNEEKIELTGSDPLQLLTKNMRNLCNDALSIMKVRLDNLVNATMMAKKDDLLPSDILDFLRNSAKKQEQLPLECLGYMIPKVPHDEPNKKPPRILV
ncbi:hypothetical protein ACFL4D_01795 [Candidatus Margulisiibacteriota bacterium]